MRRGLHISEDVYAGFNHVLRVVFWEFMEAGKGRDNGFDGINGFAARLLCHPRLPLLVGELAVWSVEFSEGRTRN